MAEAEVPDAQWPVFLEKSCDLCVVNNISFKCLNCDDLLCDSCKKTHLKSKMTKNHKVVCLETAEIYQSSEGETKCPIHAAEDLLMYCETCNFPICRNCVISGCHNNHQMVKIKNVIVIKQRELSKLITESKEKSSKYKDVVEIIDKNSQQFSQAVSKKIEQVNSRNNMLKNKLEKIKTDFISKLKDADKKNKKAMTELKQRLQGEEADLNNLIQQCEVKQRNKNIEFVQFVSDISERLDKFNSHNPPDNPTPPSLVTRDVDDDELKNLFGYLDTKTAKVHPLLTQPPVSTAVDVKIVNSFTSKNELLVTVGNAQAWLWRRCNKVISLVTSDGNVVQNIYTDFKLYDAAISTSGDLLVTVWLGNKVKMLTSDNTFTDVYTANDHLTWGITVTDTGNILVALYNYNDSKIVEITTSGQLIRTIQHDTVNNKPLFQDPKSICTNSNDDIIVVDNNYTIKIVNKSGTKRLTYNGKERNRKQPFHPQCVVTDKYGNILITDCNNSVVHMLNQDGKFLKYLITDEHGCDDPCGMSIDTSGRLWVCNARNGKIFIVKYEN